ncbi:fibronectin type III and SPRY domain-containing protein 2 [Mixophyes fleayi]|uniref:fibronectin type III and SPRY domain-containing protein 2 n=1 Tax=Mixophyes fleayi TaxID=3061075 RepID=UPI003F4DA3A2
METGKVEEFEVVRPDDDESSIDSAEEQLETIIEENEPEQEDLTFYHTDVCDSQGRLGIVPETIKEEHEEELEEAATETWSPGSDQVLSGLQKEVGELATVHGLSEDKDSCLTTQSLQHTPRNQNAPDTEKTLHKQDKISKSVEENDFEGNKLLRLPSTEIKQESEHLKFEGGHSEHIDKHTQDEIEEQEQEVKHSRYTDGHCKGKELEENPGQENERQEQSGSPVHKDECTEHTEAHQENREQLDTLGDASSIVSKTEAIEGPHTDNQVNDEKEEPPNIFCVSCKTPIRASETSGIHKGHDVKQIAAAVEEIKEEIQKNMCKLEEQIAQMDNFASHLEEIFITVEENFGRQDQNIEMHYTEVMDTITSKHEEKLQALGEEKKLKLESLFEQLIDCGKSLDTSKDLMEKTQELFKRKDKVKFVKIALDTTNRLQEYFNTDINLNISTNADFQINSSDFSDVEQLLDSINTLPVPSAPVINPQTPNSATATSLRVCWSLFSDDTVERYHLYYKPVSDVTPGEDREEFIIRSKETYCTVKNLMPNTQYEFWVIAINASGESPASESAVYVTAPAPPIIKTRECLSCENAALICWESGNINPVDSYTVEIYNVTNEVKESSISESIVGIPICESLIQLNQRETYHISVRAVNVGGPSESSKSITIHTTGTSFYLNEETAHPRLAISDNGFTISCEEEESLEDLPYHCNNFSRCIAVLGNLIPFRGKHYWEVEVDECTEYRVGVAYEDTNRNGVLGANNTSWCLRHICTPKRHKYEFLHCGVSPDIRITILPSRIGILLDYDCERISYFNMNILQHLYTFECHFRHLVHPCFALEKPGYLKIHNGIPIPQSLILS